MWLLASLVETVISLGFPQNVVLITLLVQRLFHIAVSAGPPRFLFDSKEAPRISQNKHFVNVSACGFIFLLKGKTHIDLRIRVLVPVFGVDIFDG